MRVTFPHMGNICVALKAAFERVGVDFIIPPPTSQHTLDLGVRYSPEMVCLPFKLTLGNMIEALELGADTIAMVGQYGPCRFGYYHKVQELILRKLGYNFQLVKESLGIMPMVKHLTNGAPLWKVIAALRFGLAKLGALDELERVVHKVRATEKQVGNATRIYRQGISAIDQATDYQALDRAKQDYLEKLMNVPIVSSPHPVRVGVVGEFFVVVDSFANMDIEIELGRLGAEVCRPQSIREWIRFNPFLIILGLREKDRSHKAAMPYLSRHVGGDGWQSVGEKVLHAKDWDGLVHLEPFGCLPETMARNIMSSTKESLPTLTIAYDEHTGKAGMVNRLEAFIDMVYRKKRGKVKTCA